MSKLFFLLVVAFSITLNTWAGKNMATREHVGMFLNSKTYVVVTPGQVGIGAYLRSAIEKYWKITEFEFIEPSKFEELRYSSKNSFIFISRTSIVKDQSDVMYNFLNLVLGDTTTDMSMMPEFCSLPVSYSSDYMLSSSYALPGLVLFMQKHIDEMKKGYIQISINNLDYYNRYSRNLPLKNLLLVKEGMVSSLRSDEKISVNYKSPFELTDLDNIESVLEYGSSDQVFLHYVLPPEENDNTGRCFVMILGADGSLYYYRTVLIKDANNRGLSAFDLKSMK
jgi:hypothetical protein